MVMNLPLPTVCSLNLITEVVAERQGGVNATFFTNIELEWRNKVQEYINHGGSPEFIRTWPEVLHKKNSFLSLYKSPAKNSVQGTMLQSLRDHYLNLCPACGEAGKPNTLDHYLPKGKYPHFSITPLNLFPMCDACQNAKKEKTGNHQESRFFIHPYFDTFSTPQIVILSILPPFSTAGFIMAPNPNLTAYEKILVNSHLRELEILERYIKFFRDEHTRLLRNVHKMRESNQDIMGTLEVFLYNASYHTVNSWEHIFYQSVLDNTEFLEFLHNEDLPDYL